MAPRIIECTSDRFFNFVTGPYLVPYLTIQKYPLQGFLGKHQSWNSKHQSWNSKLSYIIT